MAAYALRQTRLKSIRDLSQRRISVVTACGLLEALLKRFQIKPTTCAFQNLSCYEIGAVGAFLVILCEIVCQKTDQKGMTDQRES